MIRYARMIKCARRPKNENVDDSFYPNEEEIEEEEEEEELDEEVDFDNPSFKHEQIWTDYAEDLDYDQ